MAATLDGVVQSSGAVFESKFKLPWSFSEHGAAAKYMPQLQHNMWVVAAKNAVLSVITGGGKWVEIKIHATCLPAVLRDQLLGQLEGINSARRRPFGLTEFFQRRTA